MPTLLYFRNEIRATNTSGFWKEFSSELGALRSTKVIKIDYTLSQWIWADIPIHIWNYVYIYNCSLGQVVAKDWKYSSVQW